MSAAQQLMVTLGVRPLVVPDVFSATAYTGNGSTQTITNGVNLAGNGGMVWLKPRSTGNNINVNSAHGLVYSLVTNTTGVESTRKVQSFNSTGFSLPVNTDTNATGVNYVSWTFRKAPKFFDVVTYTGGGSMSDVVAHSLGVIPGLIIAKRTDVAGSWGVNYLVGDVGSGGFIGYSLESTAAQRDTSNSISGRVTNANFQPSLLATAGSSFNDLNISGASYVAYLFANDTGTDGLIRCGKYTGNGSATGPTVTLGWEPQFLMVKNSTGTGDWVVYDSARDATNPRTATLLANSSAAESVVGPDIDFTSAGFQIKSSVANVNTSGSTYIYMAIRKP